MAKREPDSEDIIKYLGYQVYPGKVGEFWQSEDEKKKYIKEVQARGGQMSALERETALLNIKLMNPADKVISFIGSALLILAFFLPVYSFNVHGRQVSGSALSFFLNLPVIGGYASWGGAVMIVSLFLFSLFLAVSPVVGIINILGLVNKSKGDDYIEGVKRYSRFVFIPLLLLGALLLVMVIGTPQPFGSLGVSALGETFGLGAIFTLTGLGFWMSIAGLAIVFAERRGL